MPVHLHTVTQLHPQFGLLLGGHGFPALLDAGNGRVRDGMLGRGAGLLRGNGLLLRLGTGVQASHWARDGAVGTNGSGGHGRAASSGPGDGLKEHCAGEKGAHTQSIEGKGKRKKKLVNDSPEASQYQSFPGGYEDKKRFQIRTF